MGNKISASCPLNELYEGEEFEGIYEVDESHTIGTGKFAVVHMCNRKSQPERKFALKVINTRVGDMASLNRIHEEINILQVLGSHPGLVSLIDVDEQMPGAIRYSPADNYIARELPKGRGLVLELCEGGELYDRIQQKQYYPEVEAKAAVRCLLEAVAYIHSHGIMHRDLKPENILLASRVSNTELKISDFGLAKMSKDYPRRLPRSHSICGSDFYLAPEVIKQEEYGREIDIWALGVITYVLLSGALPFFHQVLHKLYRQIVERDLSFPDQAWKNVSKGALDFILRLLQVRPGDRLTADQALSHPWLRNNGSSAPSFNSFTSAHSGEAMAPNYYSAYGGYGGMPRPMLHPLEHAHKV